MDKEKPIKSLYVNKILNDKCKICNKICKAIRFQQNFEN